MQHPAASMHVCCHLPLTIASQRADLHAAAEHSTVQAKKAMDSGALVADDIVVGLIEVSSPAIFVRQLSCQA